MKCPFCKTECEEFGGYGNYFCPKCESECTEGNWLQGLTYNEEEK